MQADRHRMVPPPPIDEFLTRSGLVLIEFWAQWSGAAFLVGRVIDQLLRSQPGREVQIGRVDIAAHPEIAARFHVDGPMLLLFLDGAVIAQRRGLVTLEDLSAWLDQALATQDDRTLPPNHEDES